MKSKIFLSYFLIIGFLGHFTVSIKILKEEIYFEDLDCNPTYFKQGEVDINKIQFHLYTKENPFESRRLYVNSTLDLELSKYDINDETKFIVHGFTNNIQSEVIQVIKDNLLNCSAKKYNVIGVDWSYYSSTYNDVVNRTKGTGKAISELVDFLVSQGSQLKDIHLIGHSLGAHVCGFAGLFTKNGKISRITGLDPALPGFSEETSDNRLDGSDALFVDCIHTCGGFLGFLTPICSADYYPNGGAYQPGCYNSFGTCSHSRSYQYFAESIIKGHNFPVLTCSSLDFDHKCINGSAQMGYFATSEHTGIFYSLTNPDFPFSMYITTTE